MTDQPKRDDAAVDEAIRHLDKLRAFMRAREEEERIRRWNEQQIPALLRKQAG